MPSLGSVHMLGMQYLSMPRVLPEVQKLTLDACGATKMACSSTHA